MNGDDSRDGGAGEMAVETASSHLNGGHLLGEDNVELAAIGGESGPRVGDDHQAVIPNLSSRDGQGGFLLRLWCPVSLLFPCVKTCRKNVGECSCWVWICGFLHCG